MDQFDVPILFCTFNRLECTKMVFERIRRVKPTRLYLLSDGPRENVIGEDKKVNEVREYLNEHIDWECQIHRNYAKKNMGCGKRMSSGISWAFESEEKLIILEDDCLVDLSFFRFCKELLNLYENEKDVLLIGGYNPLGNLKEVDSFIFTHIMEIWGWATWKRVWNQYDYNISDWKEHRTFKYLKEFMDDKAIRYYSKLFDSVFNHGVDTWDYQLQYLLFQKESLAIVPSRNMVKNIGFSVDATHTKTIPAELYNESHKMNFPMRIPLCVKCNESYNKRVLEIYVK